MSETVLRTALAYLVDELGTLPFKVGVTEDNFPVMLTPRAHTPPPEELITDIFLQVFQGKDWAESAFPKCEDIKFPRIGEHWVCALVFFASDGQLVEPSLTPEELLLVAPNLRMMDRLIAEGNQPHWYICSPHMPQSSGRIWGNFREQIIAN